jgi:ABC-2 type transport system permease protein
MRTKALVDMELERAWRTRTTWAVAGGMLAVAVLVAYGATHSSPGPAGAVPAAQEVRDALSGVAALRVFVMLLGVLAVTSQYHHGDIVWRYLADPSRRFFVAAKAAASAVIGAFLGLAVLQVAALLALVDLGPGGGDALGFSTGEMTQSVAGTVLGMALAGVVGVGIGAAVRSQTAAVVGTLVAVLLVEPLITAVVPAVGAVLPIAAAAAAAGGTAAVGWGAGMALTVAYAGAAAVAGTLLCARHDV